MTQDLQQAITHVLQQDSKVLDTILLKLKQLNQLQDILAKLLDPKLAENCYVANLENNCLVVMTHSALWATQFRFQIPDLLSRLRQHPLLYGLKTINCKIRLNHKPEIASPVINITPMPRLSGETAQIILDTAKNIQHTKLKAIMERIALNTQPL